MNIASNIGAALQGIQANGYFSYSGAQQQAQFGALQAQIIREVTDDPDTWNETEVLKMFKWFMKMHHEEDIKGFKAMRDIERSIERADLEAQQNSAHQRYSHGWTNPFTHNPFRAIPTPAQQQQPKKKWWEVWK